MDSSISQCTRLGVLAVVSLALGLWTPPLLPQPPLQIGVGLSSRVLDSPTPDWATQRRPRPSAGTAGRAATIALAPSQQSPAQVTALASGPPYWLPVTSMHSERGDFAAAVGRDGRIYALGGGDATVEAYIPATKAWQFVASMPQPRDSFAATAGPDGRIYAISGNAPEINLSAIAYAPRQNRWVAVQNTVSSHIWGAAATGPDGRIYAIGGNGAEEPVASVEAYDPHTDTWVAVADLPTPRGYMAAATGLDGRIYTLGGVGPPFGRNPLSVVEAYSVQTQRWVALRSLPQPLQNLAAAAGPDGRIYAIGGTDALQQPLRAVHAYDAHTNRWTAVAPLRTPRSYLAAVRGADGRIYALGGANATVEAYGPLIQVLPSGVLTGTNFAASATVSVTWGSAPTGRLLATGRTNRAGALLQSLRFHVPAGVAPGRYSVVAEDDRSRYPVTASLAVGVPASFGLAPTPLPLPTATATAKAIPTPSPQTRYVAPLGHDAPDCSRVAAPCRTIGYAVGQAVAEDTIQIAAGLYRERVILPTGLRLSGAGAGKTVLDGDEHGTVLTTAPAWAVTLSGVTVRNGSDRGAAPFGGGIANNGGILTVTASVITANHATSGGGIFNRDGTLTVIDSTISANSAVSFGGGIVNLLGRVTVRDSIISANTVQGDGGGIANVAGVEVTVLDSTLSGNTAGGNGGGIVNVTSARLTVRNSTLSGNSARQDGGGIANTTGLAVQVVDSTLSANHAGRRGGGIANTNPWAPPEILATLAVQASTLSDNSAGTAGGGIANTNPRDPQTVTGTILAGNTVGTVASDCAGTLTSGGANLLGTSGGCTWLRRGHTADQVGTAAAPRDPLLGPLQDNGGSTYTQALLPGSPALDAIPASTAACPAGTADQRGVARPYPAGGACDSGALEMRYPQISAVRPFSGPVTGGAIVALSGTALTGVLTVTVGTRAVAPARVVTDPAGTALTITVPPGEAAGPVDVRVTTREGRSPRTAADRFRYAAASESAVRTMRRGVVTSRRGERMTWGTGVCSTPQTGLL